MPNTKAPLIRLSRTVPPFDVFVPNCLLASAINDGRLPSDALAEPDPWSDPNANLDDG